MLKTNEPLLLATSSDMKKMDADCVQKQNISFAGLMERAAKAVFDCIMRRGLSAGKIAVLCGRGNNGGDGRILGRLLREIGADVSVVDIPGEIPEDSELIIDAIFGTGFRGELSGGALCAVQRASQIQSAKKIAIDVPSGIDCDDGTADERAFQADLTVTFEFIKRGMVSYPAAAFTGEIETVSIGFPKSTRDILLGNPHKSVLLTRDYAKIPRVANKNTNKGDFGKLLAVCGSKYMTGAAYFAAMGALRTGVGLLYLASEDRALDILQTKLNEPVFVPLENIGGVNPTAALAGPGLGIENGKKIVPEILRMGRPAVIDADGLNALCENIDILRETETEKILTPHPGEMARLCRAAGFDGVASPADVQKNRINTASSFARKYGCVLVLKGANTIIADENGDIYINPTGNPGMSKGGSGDILAGMAASYLAQGVNPVKAACAAAYLHGLAGDAAAERYSEAGMIPSDMLDILAELQK